MRGRIRRLVLSLAARLGEPLGTRLVRIAGRVSLGPVLKPGSDPALALILHEAERAAAAGDLAAARVRVDIVHAQLPRLGRATRLRREVMLEQGDWPAVVRQDYDSWTAGRSDAGADALRWSIGLATATSEGWTPHVSLGRRADTASRPVVLLLVEPDARRTGGLERLARRAGALRAEGIDTIAVGPLTAHGGDSIQGPFTRASVEARDLQFGGYPADEPLDRRLDHEAWLTVRATASGPDSPSLVHVVVTGAGLGRLLTGRAVADALGVPLVCELDRGSANDSAAPADVRLDDAAARSCLRTADRVLVATSELRDHVLGYGVESERVLVVAPDEDPATAGTRLAEVYRALAATSALGVGRH